MLLGTIFVSLLLNWFSVVATDYDGKIGSTTRRDTVTESNADDIHNRNSFFETIDEDEGRKLYFNGPHGGYRGPSRGGRGYYMMGYYRMGGYNGNGRGNGGYNGNGRGNGGYNGNGRGNGGYYYGNGNGNGYYGRGNGYYRNGNGKKKMGYYHGGNGHGNGGNGHANGGNGGGCPPCGCDPCFCDPCACAPIPCGCDPTCVNGGHQGFFTNGGRGGGFNGGGNRDSDDDDGGDNGGDDGGNGEVIGPNDACNICGEGNEVTTPNNLVSLEDDTCEDLQAAARQGTFDAEECNILQAEARLRDSCGCTGDTPQGDCGFCSQGTTVDETLEIEVEGESVACVEAETLAFYADSQFEFCQTLQTIANTVCCA